jgi:hypothetical protein
VSVTDATDAGTGSTTDGGAAEALASAAAGSGGRRPIDPAVVLRSPVGRRAVVHLGERLRECTYDCATAEATGAIADPVVRFALGMTVPALDLAERWGEAALADLVEGGLAESLDQPTTLPDGSEPVGGPPQADPLIALRFAVFAAGGLFTIVPTQPNDAARVYLGPDSFWLLDLVWRLAPGGRRAADLATGTGMLAPVLARRYETVVAADIMGRAVAVAALTRLVNGDRASGMAVVRNDISSGLRRGTFDLVTTNAPWVPDAPVDEIGLRRIYADGGPTGIELPRRFALEAAELLAPGGLAIQLCLDARRTDGVPTLDDVRSELEERGFTTEVVATRATERFPDFEKQLVDRIPGLVSARHVALLTTRT